MRHQLATVILGAATLAALSGCAGVSATTTPAKTPNAAAGPTASATAPAAPTTAPPPAAAAPAPAADVPGCVPLFTNNLGNLAAATYLANSCTMDGNTVQLTGSATTPDGRFIQYPTGLRVDLAEVQHMPNSYGSAANGPGYLEPSYTLVRIDLTVTNTGTTPASLGAMPYAVGAFSLMYGSGVNAATNPGIIDDANTTPLVRQDNPPAVSQPGAPVDLYKTFDVPTADLSTMSVVVDPAPNAGYTPYRMTDLNQVMVDYH